MTNDVFTLDENNNAAIRTLSVNGVAETNSPSVFTEDENGNACIRVTGDVTIGINDILPDQTGKSGYVLGTDGFVAGWVKPEQIQRSALPQASEEEVDKIYQYVGTTDATYTNGYFYKCVSDGQVPATYSWVRVDVQPAGATIDDTSTSSLTETWSASKLNTMIGDVETLLSQI